MAHIVIKMKDGTVKDFPDERRPGGSYETLIKFEGGFVIVTDVWGVRTAIPAEDVAEVVETPRSRY